MRDRRSPRVAYRNVGDLAVAIQKGLSSFPDDIDIVVGIPRSGLLAANLFSMHRGLPLTDLNGLVEGRLFDSGSRLDVGDPTVAIDRARRILVLDDSAFSGRSIARARAAIEPTGLADKVCYGAVFVVPRAVELVDHHCEVVAPPRVFSWNTMSHSVLGRSCVDIDGVLCVDPSEEENDDGARYQEFLATARPLARPTRRIAHIVTSRLEKYREPTERWLATNGVEYGTLHMLDLPDAASRRSRQAHIPFKVDRYRNTDTILFIESDPRQAREIARLTGKPVACPNGHEFHEGEPRLRRGARHVVTLQRGVRRRIRRVGHRLDGRLSRRK